MRERFTLPLFLEREFKYPAGLGMFLIAALLYLVTNHFHFWEPALLPMTKLDHAIPFMPNTSWAYMSEYLLFAFVYILCHNMDELNKFIYSFLALQVVSNIVFFLWPTTYPRDLFPLPDDLNSLTKFAFSSLRQTDSPANCCPSLHVSSVYLGSLLFLQESKKKFVFFFIWATVVAVTTLTTKQHYIVDVIVGLLMAIFIYWLFHRVLSYTRKNLL